MALKPEQIEQIKLFKWIHYNKKITKCSFSIPNDGKRTPITAHIMKLMGMRPGVSDLFIAYPTKKHHGLFVELKAKDKNGAYRKPTSFQIEFLKDMIEQGYAGSVCNGADAAIELIENYLKEKV